MPINEQSKQNYLQARDVFVESYKDFLRKLLCLLDEAEQTTGNPEIRQDVANFADEVKILRQHIDDYQTEEERAKLAAVPAAVPAAEPAAEPASEPDDSRSQDQEDAVPKPPSPGEKDYVQPIAAEVSTSSPPKYKTESQSQESAEELQAEVESAPSQLTASEEPLDEAPQVFAPPATDDGRVVSAFCAFRYHKAEFRQLFTRQGSNNNSCCGSSAAPVLVNNAAAAASADGWDLLESAPPPWLGALAQYTLHLMRRAFRTATPEQWEALKSQLAGLGFKAEEHFALWLRLSAAAPDDVTRNPGRVFDAIPTLAGLPTRLALETKIMLQTLNLISG